MVKFSKRSISRNEIIKSDDENVELSILTKQFKPLLKEKQNVLFIVISLLLLIVGIVLIILAKTKLNQCEPLKDTSTTTFTKLKTFDPCEYSQEAKRIKLGDFLFKVRDQYHNVFPEETAWHPNLSEEMLVQKFKMYDPRPENVKKVTDTAYSLLNEAKSLNPDLSLLKPREHKSYLRVRHFLENIFANPNLNYYFGLWMLGPSSFCTEPICHIGYSLYNAVGSMIPSDEKGIELVILHLKQFNQTVYQYIDVLRMGIERGMVRTLIECQAGIDAIKVNHINISQNGATGIVREWYVSKFYTPSFYYNISNELTKKYIEKHKKNVTEYIQEAVQVYVGNSLKILLDYLEFDHYLYCRPDNVGGAGLSALPLSFIYYNGSLTSNKTIKYLPFCNEEKCILNGSKAYEQVIGYYTTKDIHPTEVNKLGWENLNRLYPQVIEIATKETNEINSTLAVEKFKILLKNLSLSFFHDEPLPENETRGDAFRNCATAATAEINCPTRWKAMMKWFEFAQMTMSIHDPNTVDFFYFTGDRHSTPNCPVKLQIDFNPSQGAQSYDSSDGNCTFPCRYNIPFFLENLGPKFSEYSVNAHEARPGHHTQVQGLNEHFRDKCNGPESWLDDKTYYTAFTEGWGLYAENPLIAQDTNIYDDNLMQKYGMLKWQIWRALRLIVDTGIHYNGMSRIEALELFSKYAWDDSDLTAKEVTRYQSNFGQAVAYMIGQLDIWSLRNMTEEKLGTKLYDIKEFHLQVLSQGSSPLQYLHSYINKYIECKQDPEREYCDIVLNPTLANGNIRSFARNENIRWPQQRHYI